MTAFLWSIGLLFSVWLIHLALWRVRMPRNHTIGLLLLFFTLPCPLALVALSFGIIAPESLAWLQIASLYAPCALCYVIAYSAIEHESPTCQMVRLIHSHGGQGIAHEALLATLKPEGMIEVRLASLHSTGTAAYENGAYRLLPKGERMARLFSFAARIFGIKRQGM